MNEAELPSYYDHRIPDLRMRFLHEAGTAFMMGLAGSSAFNLFRFRGGGGLRAAAARAPRAAGLLAAYFAVCSAVDSAVSIARRKEDRWNVLAGGAAAWAALGARRGAAGAATLGLYWIFEMVECRFPEWYKDTEDTSPPTQPQRTRPLPAAGPAAGGVDSWVLGIQQGPPIGPWR